MPLSHLEDYRIGSKDKLNEVLLPSGYPLASLYFYRDLVRDNILDFKMRGYWQVGCRLAEGFAKQERVQEWVVDADAVMPAPSSFWSRFQGRFDLAYLLARKLSEESGLPFLSAPWSTYMRFQKQAFLKRQDRSMVRPRSQKGSDFGDMTIVLVDDVASTANTLTGIAQGFRNGRFKFLTLASAYDAASP